MPAAQSLLERDDQRHGSPYTSQTDERDDLLVRYYPLAEYLARRFRGRGEPIEDLVQVASIGLIKAIDRFDPERGFEFATYATPTILGELKRHFRDSAWPLRVPRRLQELDLRVRLVVAELHQQLGRSPTVSEIATRSGLSEEDVVEAMETGYAVQTASLDRPVGEEGETPGAFVGDEDEGFEVAEAWASLSPLLKQIPERERKILILRFFHDLTQGEIAEELGISQMHVSRLLSRTLEKLRTIVDDVGP